VTLCSRRSCMHIVKVVRRDLVREKIQSVAILMWYPKHCNILQHTATHFNTLQHNASHCKSLQSMQHTATYRNTSHQTATHMQKHTCYTYIPAQALCLLSVGKGGCRVCAWLVLPPTSTSCESAKATPGTLKESGGRWLT